MKIIPILIVALTLSSAYSAESDHYTLREEPLQDIKVEVNQRANEYLEEGVQKANSVSSCENEDSEIVLYTILKKYFANHTKGQLLKDILHSDEFTKRVIPINKSIYKEWSWYNGWLLSKNKDKGSAVALSPMMQMGEQLVGVDKLEHMFGMGFIYFKRHYLGGVDLKSVLKRGIAMEKTTLGGNILATGVFAFADLSANFNGMRFWNHVLQRRDDVLGKKMNIGPYVTCKNGAWETVKNNPIDFTNYMDASMDESINCSIIASKSGAEKYKRAIYELSPDYTCPMDLDKYFKIRKKYRVTIESDKEKRPISYWIFNSLTKSYSGAFNLF